MRSPGALVILVATTLAVVAAMHAGSAPLALLAVALGAGAFGVRGPLAAWLRARRLAAIPSLSPAALERALESRDATLGEAAAVRLLALQGAGPLVARLVASATDARGARGALALARAFRVSTGKGEAVAALLARWEGSGGDAL